MIGLSLSLLASSSHEQEEDAEKTERKASARIVTEVQDAVAVLLLVTVLVAILSYVGDLALVMRDDSKVEG